MMNLMNLMMMMMNLMMILCKSTYLLYTAPELTSLPSEHSRPQHVECVPNAARFLYYKEGA